MIKGISVVFGALALCVVTQPDLRAQAVGSIVGVVMDRSQAVVPNAKVTAVQTGTNFTRTVTTSSTGGYTIPLLPVGSYTVTAEGVGLEKSSVQVSLDVDQRREVDFTVDTAGVATSVNVEETTP